MINGWQIVPLSEFLTERKEFFTIDDFTRYKRARVQSHGKGIVLRDEIDGVEIKTKKQQTARAGEFLVAEIDAKVGGFGIVPHELDGAVVSSHYFLFQINEEKCLKDWLNWFVRYNSLEEQVKAQGSTNYAAIRPSHVLNFKITLPPLNEQRRILTHLEALAIHVAKAKSLRNGADIEFEAFTRSLSRDIFSKIEKETKIFKTLVETGKVSTGGTPSKGNIAYWEGDIPWVSPKDVKVDNIFDTQDHISTFALENGAAKLIPENSILIVVRSGILLRTIPVAINRIPVTVNQDIKVIAPYQDVLPEYLRWWIKGNEHVLLENVKGGTTVQSLMWEKASKIKVPVPPLDEQRRIVAYLDSVQARLASLRELQSATGEELSALLPSVLDKAFKGEL